jgi:hypothetical protein
LADRFRSDEDSQVDRRDSASDEFGWIGAGGKLAAVDGTGDDGFRLPVAVFEEAPLCGGYLGHASGVRQRHGGERPPGGAGQEPDQ